MLFGSTEEPFNGFFSFVVDVLVACSASQIFTDLNVIIPNMSFNDFNVIFAFGALIYVRTFFTFGRTTLVYSFSFSVGSRIL